MQPVPPLTEAWRAWGRNLATIVAATFAVGTLLGVLDGLNITTAATVFPPGVDFPDRILADLQNQSQRFPWVLAGSLVGAAGFAALAALAPVLRRALRAPDWRGSVLVGGLVLGGAIGIVAELGFIGGQVVASNATYCDCDFADIQLVSRAGLLDLVSTVQTWLLAGSVALIGLGLAAAPRAAREAPGVPPGWRRLTAVLALLMVLIAIWITGLPLVVDPLGLRIDVDTITAIPSLVVLLILVPWWALWLRAWLAGGEASD
jgi:hypothetical protein